MDQHCNVQLSGVAFRNREGLCYGRLRSLWRHRPFADVDVDVDVDVATQLLAYIEWLPPMLVDGTTEYAHLKQLPVVHHVPYARDNPGYGANWSLEAVVPVDDLEPFNVMLQLTPSIARDAYVVLTDRHWE